jgi:dTMP kinase
LVPRGKFISFEGGEGAGKSTQARLLKAALESRGVVVALTREPGGSLGAEEIRKLLVEGEPERWNPLAETLLFLAARADHMARTIEPTLVTGAWVISDRFADSTVVYQGLGRGVGVELVRELQELAFPNVAPQLTFVLDLDPAVGLKRTHARMGGGENRFECFDGAFHSRLREGYLSVAAREPGRCVVISAAAPEADVAAKIWCVVEERLHL